MTPLRTEQTGAVVEIIIDAPPINLYDGDLHRALAEVLTATESDPSVRVRVVSSADDDFFIAHYDVADVLEEDTSSVRASVGPFTRFVQQWTDSEKVTIAKVRGAARGGGCEFLLGLDMRFAAVERARFGFPESALGILAAGGGTQRLTTLIGRARSLEVLLGHADLDATTAQEYGLINRALPDAELDAFVDDLAHRIASLPDATRRLTKMAVAEAALPTDPTRSGFALEATLLDTLKRDPTVRARMAAFLEGGGQTREGEMAFGRLTEGLRALDAQ